MYAAKLEGRNCVAVSTREPRLVEGSTTKTAI
jgi:hypothetical protein